MEIVDVKKAIRIAKRLKVECKKIVLVGGCFDILHVGHVVFLEKAKKKGDVLVVLLESDETIKRLKGKSRPINTQKDRAKLLASLQMVDVVVCLPDMKSGDDYNKLVMNLRPDVIAITGDDKIKEIKNRQAKTVGGRLYVVTKRVGGYSTTRLREKLRRGKGSGVVMSVFGD